MNVETQVEFELVYFELAAEHVNHDATRTSPVCKDGRHVQNEESWQ